ncbi:MAG: LPS export ABC transporter permease LptG [Candidatus Cloacimonetes bacterium]|nr:LPS export ABC transporter permease LptG [Candidatus Cloacimonadota bacterium]
MRILDRYIIREFLKTYLIIFFSFAAVFMVIDIVDHLPRLLRNGATFQQATLYYVLRLPYLLVLTSPVTVLLTGLFMMNGLSKHNESVAIRAAGVSIKRAMFPLFIIGFIISIAVTLMGEYLLPYAESKRDYVYRVQIKGEQPDDQMLKARIHYQGTDSRFFFIGFFDGYNNTMRIVDITQLDFETGDIRKKVTASSAVWQNDQWLLQDCDIREFSESRQTSWRHFTDVILPELDVKPRDFIRISKKTMALNFFELRDYIQSLNKLGEDASRETVDLHIKLSFPLTNLIVIFFFLPIATSNTRSKGRGWIFMLGLLVCFLYLIVMRVSQSLGYNAILPPILAAWAPNAFFTLLGFAFLYKSEV